MANISIYWYLCKLRYRTTIYSGQTEHMQMII